MCDQQQTHFTLWNLGRQQLEVTFNEGPIVADAGLVAVRALDRSLGILADLAARLPDPRDPLFVRHSTERLLTQQVYQLLAGYPDCNDADDLRRDPLFQILADVAPDPERPLASGSTLARFQYAFTRRQLELPPEDRPVLREVSFSLRPGEAFGLVGESGSGKSMTARAIDRLLPAGAQVTGSIRFAGQDVSALTGAGLRRYRGQVAMIFQDPRAHTNPVRRIGDFMTEALRTNMSVPAGQARRRRLQLDRT